MYLSLSNLCVHIAVVNPVRFDVISRTAIKNGSPGKSVFDKGFPVQRVSAVVFQNYFDYLLASQLRSANWVFCHYKINIF